MATIRLIETDSKFLEVAGNMLWDGEKTFYYLPNYYEKVGENLYKEYEFEELPDNIVEIIPATPFKKNKK